MKRTFVGLALLVGAVLLVTTIPLVGLSFGMPQGGNTSLCGRVVAVTCDGPSSAVTLSLVMPSLEPQRRQMRQILLPPEYRRQVGPAIEGRYEGQVVCMPSYMTLPSEHGRTLVDPTRLTVNSSQEPWMALPPDVFRSCDPDVLPAKAVRTVRPLYTGDAMHAKVQGSVVLLGVVDRNGGVQQVRVVESLEPGLDAEAQKAFEQWRFRPATRNGEPVALGVTVEMTFTLR